MYIYSTFGKHKRSTTSLWLCVRVCVYVVVFPQFTPAYWHTMTSDEGRATAPRTGCFCQAAQQRTIFLTLSLFISLPAPASQSIPQPLYLCSLSLFCLPPHATHLSSQGHLAFCEPSLAPSHRMPLSSNTLCFLPRLIIMSLLPIRVLGWCKNWTELGGGWYRVMQVVLSRLDQERVGCVVGGTRSLNIEY